MSRHLLTRRERTGIIIVAVIAIAITTIGIVRNSYMRRHDTTDTSLPYYQQVINQSSDNELVLDSEYSVSSSGVKYYKKNKAKRKSNTVRHHSVKPKVRSILNDTIPVTL
jgi:hypothetical protein